jgi:citrate synthase
MSDNGDLFRTTISRVAPGKVTLRGYDIGDIIANNGAAEVTFLVIRGRRPTASELQIFNAILAVCCEHGFVNSAAAASRYVMSGSASVPAALAAGILAFGQHTGTCHLTAEMLIHLSSGKSPNNVADESIAGYVVDLRSRKLAIQGFGHPIHRDNDPRQIALRKLATRIGLATSNIQLLDRIEQIASRIIGRHLPLNVDGLIGALMLEMGFTSDEIFAVTILACLPGIAAHAVEEKAQDNRLRYPRNVEYCPVADRRWNDSD